MRLKKYCQWERRSDKERKKGRKKSKELILRKKARFTYLLTA
jgi:hypothetical protein